MRGAARAAVVMVAVFCGVAFGETRVIGGTTASYSEYPAISWQVALQTTVGNLQRLCGGSIISPTHILTAGHCVRDLSAATQSNPQNMVAIPGQSRVGGSGARNVLRYFVDPTYTASRSQEQRIDLAIVEVTSPFSLDSRVAVIPMCNSSCYAAGTPVIVSGYGETQSDQSSSTSTTLQYANLLAIDQTTCRLKFEQSFGCTACLPRTNVCAGPNPPSTIKDSCFGDSGGPLVRDVGTVSAPQFQLVGVVSSGTVPAGRSPSCGVAGEYGLYVSVEQNQAWIRSVLSGAENANAVTSACVAAGTCSAASSGAGTTTVGFFGWYYVFAACIGGMVLLIMLVLCCVRWCRRRYVPRPRHVGSHSGPVGPTHYPVVVLSAPQPQGRPTYSVPPPHQTPPPPPYGAPVYQQQPPQQQQQSVYGGPPPVGPPMYAPQPQLYGAQPQAYPPQPVDYGQTTEYGQTGPPSAPPPPPYNPNR